MSLKRRNSIKIKPLFLLGRNPSFVREDGLGFRDIKEESEQDTKTDEILHQLDLDMEAKALIRKEEDLHRLNTEVDAFIIFVHSMERFPSLSTLASLGWPIILTGEENAPGDALDMYEFLADYNNVAVAFSLEEVREKVRVLNAVKWIRETKICCFDRGEHLLEGVCWLKNPLLRGKLRTEYVDPSDFAESYKRVAERRAVNLAKQWMEESEVIEPSLEEVTKSASLYLAMREMIEAKGTTIAYVLWCGQFTEMLGTKMCFAIAKLNDAGYLTGCWRGENLLPMLILHALSERPVFFGEVHMYHNRDGVISLRHCAVPGRGSYVLRRWRDKEGTVTGYGEMPKGEVTLVNSGIGDRIAVMKGEVIDCRDIGGDNCRTTVWIKIEDKEVIHKIRGREFALAYGNYLKEAKEVATRLQVEVI